MIDCVGMTSLGAVIIDVVASFVGANKSAKGRTRKQLY